MAYDPSNRDARFLRVRLRNEMIPLLASEDPHIETHLSQLASDAHQAQEVVDAAARDLLETAATDPSSGQEGKGAFVATSSLKISALSSGHTAVIKAALVMWLEPLVGGLKRSQIEALLALIHRDTGHVLLADKFSVVPDGGRLTLIRDPARRTRSENAANAR